MGRETGITGELDLSGGRAPGLPGPDALVITTDRLTKTYGRRDAVHELSFGVQRGEVYGLLGPNGAGKTTTLRMLLGLVRPTRGTALVCDARPGTPDSLARLGSLVEEPAQYPYLSGRDNLRVLARYDDIGKHRVDEVLDRVGLLPRARDKVRTYSLGMRQRLGVAAALLKDPPVLVLDEPTNGLDPQGMAQMRSLIRSLGGDRTVVLSSHMLSEVEQVCDRVGVIREGVLVAQGPVEQMRGALVLHVRADPVAVARQILLNQRDLVESVTTDGDTLVVQAPVDAAARLNAALVRQGVAVSHLTVHQRSLEDAFLDMTADVEPGGAAAVDDTGSAGTNGVGVRDDVEHADSVDPARGGSR